MTDAFVDSSFASPVTGASAGVLSGEITGALNGSGVSGATGYEATGGGAGTKRPANEFSSIVPNVDITASSASSMSFPSAKIRNVNVEGCGGTGGVGGLCSGPYSGSSLVDKHGRVEPRIVCLDSSETITEESYNNANNNSAFASADSSSFQNFKGQASVRDMFNRGASGSTAATMTTTTMGVVNPVAPPSPPLECKVDWRLINDIDVLRQLMKAPTRMNDRKAAFPSFDTAEYCRMFGKRVDLGQYNHLIVESPWMQNIWGVSQQTVQQMVSYSMKLSTTFVVHIDDAPNTRSGLSPAAELHEFVQFLARVDAVCFEHVFSGVQSWEALQNDDTIATWRKLCCDMVYDAEGRPIMEVDPISRKNVPKNQFSVEMMRERVASNFYGALRCPEKTRKSPKFRPVSALTTNPKVFDVPDYYYFNTKVQKKGDAQLVDLPCYTNEDKPRPVYYYNVPELREAYKTAVRVQVEFSGYNFVQSKFYSTWKAQKIKFHVLNSGAGDTSRLTSVADFDDQRAPVYFSEADMNAVAKQEGDFIASNPDRIAIASRIACDYEDGGGAF